MIKINKGNEPRELLSYRMQKFASYADMPADVKKKVIESLLLEQGHLCAYCMCRIDAGEGRNRATIEHCVPQAVTGEDERLNYKNMMAVCWGNRDASLNADKSCDAKRGSLPPEQQNMKVLNAFDERTLAAIQYSSDGTIFSNNADVNEDLNTRLNLNCEARQLKKCRRSALQMLQKHICEKYPNKTVSKKVFQELYTHYTENIDRKEPYCGILIAWLRKKI